MSREQEFERLIQAAWHARKPAYCPYSGFGVGAALLTKGGQIYTGCNVENAALGPSNCAERTAFFKAISEGERDFDAIAVAGARMDGTTPEQQFTAPCGVCRQVMLEFCAPEQFYVVLANGIGECRVYRLAELMPLGFALI